MINHYLGQRNLTKLFTWYILV